MKKKDDGTTVIYIGKRAYSLLKHVNVLVNISCCSRYMYQSQHFFTRGEDHHSFVKSYFVMAPITEVFTKVFTK